MRSAAARRIATRRCQPSPRQAGKAASASSTARAASAAVARCARPTTTRVSTGERSSRSRPSGDGPPPMALAQSSPKRLSTAAAAASKAAWVSSEPLIVV